MDNEIDTIRTRLNMLGQYMQNIDIKEIRDSLTLLFREAGKYNPSAIRQLSELSEQFSSLGVSLQNLASFIDRRFPALSCGYDNATHDDAPHPLKPDE